MSRKQQFAEPEPEARSSTRSQSASPEGDVVRYYRESEARSRLPRMLRGPADTTGALSPDLGHNPGDRNDLVSANNSQLPDEGRMAGPSSPTVNPFVE